jgi:hypothetical protein
MYRKSLYFMVALVLPLLAVNPVLGGDKDPPTPDPAMFSSVPSAVSSSAISMTATTGSDASPPIEYTSMRLRAISARLTADGRHLQHIRIRDLMQALSTPIRCRCATIREM